ncbi:hypothetical protein [Pedobacter steynii]
MGKKILMENSNNREWLTRNEIIEKFYHSKRLQLKMEADLLRCGVKNLNLLDDCIQQTFMELSRKPDDKIEELFNGKMNKTFEGYILNMFRNVCIKLTTDNPKGALVASILHASSINSNASISPTESSNNEDGDSYTFIQEDKPPDISINDFFEGLSESMSDEQKDTLELLIHKKNKAGRYKKEVKEKLEQLKEEIKQYATNNQNTYLYAKKDNMFKSQKEMDTSEKYLNTMEDKAFVELVEEIKEETYSIINRKVDKIKSSFKIKLKMILDERINKGEISISSVNWGCSDCVVEAINWGYIPYVESQSYADLKASVEVKKVNKKKNEK